MINKPILPPKDGYVEVVDSNGNHIYKPTNKTIMENQEALYNKEQFDSLMEKLEMTQAALDAILMGEIEL